MLNTLRSVVNDDAKWLAMIHGFYERFAHKTILTEDAVAYFNQQSGMDLTPVFNEYLRHAAIPVLELRFHEGAVDYRWKADEPEFAMPVQVGSVAHWERVTPTLQWQTMQTSLTREQFQVATDLFYVDVSRQ
jgi:aminopeptidase N